MAEQGLAVLLLVCLKSGRQGLWLPYTDNASLPHQVPALGRSQFGKHSRSTHLSRSNSCFKLAPLPSKIRLSIQDSTSSWREVITELGRKVVYILSISFRRDKSTCCLPLQHRGAWAGWTEGQGSTTPVLQSSKIPCSAPEQHPKISFPFAWGNLLKFHALTEVRTLSLKCNCSLSEVG